MTLKKSFQKKDLLSYDTNESHDTSNDEPNDKSHNNYDNESSQNIDKTLIKTKRSKKFRLLEINPIGTKGNRVRVKYYDIETLKTYEKEDTWNHVTATIELNLKKYGYNDAKELIEVLEQRFPGSFEERSYGSRNEAREEFSDSYFYREGQETSIIWHRGNREDRKKLEFFIDPKKKKQIFIRNDSERFKPRSVILPEKHLHDGKAVLEKKLEGLVLKENIKINHKRRYIEIKCKENVLSLLKPEGFRINVYESSEFKKEKDAELHLLKLQEIEGFKNNVDATNIITKRKEAFDIKYTVRISCSKNKNFIKQLELEEMHQVFDKKTNKPFLKAREELWDPLFLNSPTQQLRDFFPSHIFYDPALSLTKQANMNVPAFKHFKSKDSELELAVRDAVRYYKKNSAIIDLEVTDFDKNKKQGEITGRIFMAVLRSEEEEKIYITKEAWRTEKNKERYIKSTSSTELVFVDDEIDLISALMKDSKKYEYIIGHNFLEYDQNHLKKFNDENKLFKQGKITLEQKEKILSLRKQNKTIKLWDIINKEILDTNNYVRHRISIFENHKLGTIANFEKKLNYEVMRVLPEDIQEIINYTVNDGVKNKSLVDSLIYNAVLEGFAFYKNFSSVFSSNPFKNFYDAGARNYFMKLYTYKNRHAQSPKLFLTKLYEREKPDDLLFDLLKTTKQQEGIIKGYLFYPTVFIDSCLDIIRANPVMSLIYDSMLKEEKPDLKADLLHKLKAYIHVPLDKVKSFMNAVGLEFGKKYSLNDVFESFEKNKIRTWDLREGDINLGDDIKLAPAEKDVFVDDAELQEKEVKYFTSKRKFSDFELSRTNYVFCAEYGASRMHEKNGRIPYDYTMLEINNKIAKHLEVIKNKIIGKTHSFYISTESEKYGFGEITAINFKDKGLIGKINNLDIYLNRKKPKKDEKDLVLRMISYFLENTPTQEEMRTTFKDEVERQPLTYCSENQSYIRALTGLDPVKSKGTLSLF